MRSNTKIEHLCESVIEACWLAALAVTPLFFNIYSSRIFEPDKEFMFRSIALLMLASWLIKIATKGRAYCPATAGAPSLLKEDCGKKERRFVLKGILGIPFIVPVCMLTLSYLISALLSVSPYMSFHGSYERSHGTLTVYSFITIFFLTIAHLRTAEQWGRISYIIILASLPVSLYGIFQHSGHDPIKWGKDVSQRVTSSLGNPIFMSAYLIMAVFITLERLMSAFCGKVQGNPRSKKNPDKATNYTLAGCYLIIFFFQLTAVIFSQSRGPMLGLIAGLFVFSLLLLILLRNEAATNQNINDSLRRTLNWAWKVPVTIVIVILLFLVAVSIPDTPLAFLKEVPYVNRLSSALDMKSSTAKVRVFIWESAVNVISSKEPLVYPDGSPDRFSPIRKLFGYGPETMQLVYGQYYPPGLAHYENRLAVADRSHNDTFDSLVTSGIFGVLASLFLFVSIFYYALKQIGFVRSIKERNIFFAVLSLSAVLALFIPRMITGSFILSGLGLAAGIAIGVILYILISIFINRKNPHSFAFTNRNILIVAILSLILAHFVEIQFGIAIITTRMYFWFLAAVLVVAGTGWLCLEDVCLSDNSNAPAKAGKKGRRARRNSGKNLRSGRVHILAYAIMSGIICMTLIFTFTTNYERSTEGIKIFAQTVTRSFVNGEAGPSYMALLLFSSTLVMAGAVAVLTTHTRGSEKFKMMSMFTAVSLAVFLLSAYIFT
jgi:hypothetical protein